MNDIQGVARRMASNAEGISGGLSTPEEITSMRWKIALWERNSIEPALLRVPLVIIFFLGLWAVDLWVLERCRVQYMSVLSIRSKSSPLSFTMAITMALAIGYTVHMHACTQILDLSVEMSIAIFYSLLFFGVIILPGCVSVTANPIMLSTGTVTGSGSGSGSGLPVSLKRQGHGHGHDRDRDRDGDRNKDRDRDRERDRHGDKDADTLSLLTERVREKEKDREGLSQDLALMGQSFIESRQNFLRLIHLIIFPGDSISFAEIVLADALTSLSKVFKDIGVTIVACYAQFQGSPMVLYHDQAMLLVAILASIPATLRIRQCLVQFHGTSDPTIKIPVFLNIVKYFTAFPPIWLAAASSLGYKHHALPMIIAACSVLNSVYSYLWDVIMDWGLVQIRCNDSGSASSSGSGSSSGSTSGSSSSSLTEASGASTGIGKNKFCFCLRLRTVFFFPALTYGLIIVLNFILRFSWMANQIEAFRYIHATQLVLLVEIMEVIRRAMWNIYRIEWEIISKTIKERSFSKADDEGGIMLNENDGTGIVGGGGDGEYNYDDDDTGSGDWSSSRSRDRDRDKDRDKDRSSIPKRSLSSSSVESPAMLTFSSTDGEASIRRERSSDSGNCKGKGSIGNNSTQYDDIDT